MRDSGEAHQLIDVRETYEIEIANIGGESIPMNTVEKHLDKISKDQKVIVHCRSGARSAAIVNLLEKNGFTNAYNLKGGILAWAREIDPNMPTY